MALLTAAWPDLSAQGLGYRPPPSYIGGGKPDQAEGARILGDFRQAGIGGTYWLAFELRVMPRSGAESTVKGEIWGTPGDRGPLTRLQIAGQTWLIQGGAEAAAWVVQPGRPVRQLSGAETLQPIAGTDLTIFDLQMPFLQWPDFTYEGLARISGRPAHSFVLYPPAALAAERPGLSGVRAALDTQYMALVQVDQLGAGGKPAKSVTLLDLKKVGEQWLVKSIDLRNHETRDKTRLNFKSAALGLVLPTAVFEPAHLADRIPVVPEEKIQGL